VSNKYVLRRANPRVAVLTDNNVASSGEATAVAFRGRPNTRTFGTPTCGVPSGNSQFVLEDSAQLYLTTSRDADRTRHEYDGPLPPDETISDSNALVARAIAWLRSGA
jgi:C-terminal processing protease CtpA/Prc